jgi:hypothetical protein
VRWTKWIGRLVGILLSQVLIVAGHAVRANDNVLMIGSRCESGADIADSLGDMARLIAHAPPGCKRVAFGDFNLDPCTMEEDSAPPVLYPCETSSAETWLALLPWMEKRENFLRK